MPDIEHSYFTDHRRYGGSMVGMGIAARGVSAAGKSQPKSLLVRHGRREAKDESVNQTGCSH